MGACGSNDNTNTDSAVETAMSGSATPKREEKQDDTENQSLLNSNSLPLPPKITMSDLWANDPRPRVSYKSFPESRTYKLKSDFEDVTSGNYGFVNELVKFMVGDPYTTNSSDPSYGTLPTSGSSKLWIGDGIDQSNNEQGIVPSAGGTKFERRLIFETLDTYPVVNPIRSRIGNPPPVARVNIPNAQFLIGASTRYASRIVNNDGFVSDFVIDDACGYWLFDVTNPINNTGGVDTYLLLSNFHGLTTLYSGRLTGILGNGSTLGCAVTLQAGVDTSGSLLPVPGISYTNQLAPFNNLATYSNNSQWVIRARFDFQTGTFSYTRTKSAHPATINFVGAPSFGKNINTQLYGTVVTPQQYSLISDVKDDYIISINCATHLITETCVSIIQVTFKFGGVKTVGGQGTLDPANLFTSNNGFTQVQVNSGDYIDKIVIVSATDNSTKSYGGTGGTSFPAEPTMTLGVLKKNNADFTSIEPNLRLTSINGTYGDVINQATFTFAPINI